MSFPSHLAQSLPLDAESIHALAARSMFQLFSTMSQGMFLADRAGRIVWVNEGYQRFLPDVMLAVVIILIFFVQAIQSLGDWAVRRLSHR
jgi:ABC-type methionine transport system permease subunit